MKMEAEPIHPPLLQMEPIAQPNMPMPLPLNPPGKYFILLSTVHASLLFRFILNRTLFLFYEKVSLAYKENEMDEMCACLLSCLF